MDNKYFDMLSLENIPLDKYNCYLLTLKRKVFKNSFKVFSLELEIIFNFFNNLDYHVIIYEKNIDDFDDILKLDIMTKLLAQDILVIVFNC